MKQMLKKIKQVVFKGFFPYDKENNLSHNSLKIILLGFSFFFIIGSYSVLRPLKASVFLALIGKEYVPIAKMISIIILFPCMLFYAKLRQAEAVASCTLFLNPLFHRRSCLCSFFIASDNWIK